MDGKFYASVLALCASVALSFLAGCGGSSSTPSSTPIPTIAITATGGGGQSVAVSTAFAIPLIATVTSNGSPATGVSVTFTAPSSGATFANGTATDTEATNTGGVATSSAFTANATAGAYTVTASATGATTPASFSLNNAVLPHQTYVYYLSGQEAGAAGPHYYAAAGAITLDSAGDIIAGEQDYNDGVGNTSPGEPNRPDTIAAAARALSVDSTTGLGTLTMTLSNTKVGMKGTETFDIQFVNANHALIIQADGSATASGSFDLQTATSTTGNFAFAISGVNPSTDSVAYGGVFSATSSGATGTIDINDAIGGVVVGTTFTAITTTPDAFGRSVVTGIRNVAYSASSPVNFVTYAVGPEAMRIIDVDTTDTAVGSVFGQGSATFSNTSLTSDIFALLGQRTEPFATLGQFTTDTNGNITAGTADDTELYNAVRLVATAFNGTYSLTGSTNGYGTMTLAAGDVGDVSTIGLYMTDPKLNLNDPNNTTTDTGGALIVDLDPALPGGIGFVTPQTDTTAKDFNGNYAAGFQNFNSRNAACTGCEFDMVGPFTMTSGVLHTASIGADNSDPLDTMEGGDSGGDSYSSTPQAVSPGYFSMSFFNSPSNPLSGFVGGGPLPFAFDVDIYQASGTALYWLGFDIVPSACVSLGPLEAQANGVTFPGARKPVAKTPAKHKP